MKINTPLAVCFTLLLFCKFVYAEHESTVVEAPAIAITNATVVVDAETTVESATIVIRDGLIEAVGADVEVPFDAREISGEGMMIYPGFIDASTSKGLPDGDESGRRSGSGEERKEIDLATQIVAATRQVNRKGIFPDYSCASFIELETDDAAAWREAGFTLVHVTPTGEIMNGSSALISLDDPNRTATRDSILKSEFASIAGWSSSGRGYPSSRMGVVAHLRQTLLDGGHYQTSWEIFNRVQTGVKRPPTDPAMEVVGRMLDREIPVIFPVTDVDQMFQVNGIAEEFGIEVILDGVQEGYEFIDDLKTHAKPVILRVDFPEKPELGKSSRSGGWGLSLIHI